MRIIERNNECFKVHKKLQELQSELIDLIMFDILTLEEEMQNIIQLCKNYDVDRCELMDNLKELSADIRNLEVDEEELELLEPAKLFKPLKTVDKRLILLMISESYPEFMDAVNNYAVERLVMGDEIC